jgi:hypothetical protein
MLTTPADYINNYVNILTTEYQLNDLKVDYQGFVGFVMNLFGWTNYDIKQYYDYLFKEGFLATADETKNLYLHGSTHNYPLDFAIPAQAIGNLIFDFSKLPTRTSNIYKREIVLNSNVQISAGQYIFTTDTQYTFIEEYNGVESIYYCIISPYNQKQQIVASSGTVVIAPFINFKQQVSTTYQYNTPNYNYGTYSQYNLTVNSTDQISALDVSVKVSGSTTYEPYSIKYIKAFETPLSKTFFLTQISNTSLLLETGSGYHGTWVPNSIAQVTLYITQGTNGNSLKRQNAILVGTLISTQFDQNNIVISQNSLTINSILTADFHSSSSGTDILLGSDLKNDIVKWIETRNNLINRTDFYNLFSKISKDFSILFKKNQLTDNTFYLCKVLRDQYQNILTTTNHTYPCVQYDNATLIQNITSSLQYDLDSTLVTSRYYYKITAVDKFYESIPSAPIIQNTDTTNRTIRIQWSSVPNAEYYKVYGHTSLYNQYWIVPADQLTSDGKVYFLDSGILGLSGVCNNTYTTQQQVNFPEFNIDTTQTINLTENTYIWKTYFPSTNTYYIDNKTFWFGVDEILYNTITLTQVSAVNQLITNSWTIVDMVLYLKLDDNFTSTIDTITAVFNNTITSFSPFIYKYNSFFNWFEGYFIFNNMIQYPILSNVVTGYTPPIFYFNLVYDPIIDQTNIYIKSYQDISALNFNLKVIGIDITFTPATYDPEMSCFVYTVSGFIMSATYISLECYIDSILKFTAITPSFQQVYLVNDQVVLPSYYDDANNKYICNIPVISDETTDLDYLYSQIYDYVVGASISQNRMQSDTVQTRFLNSIYCEKYISENLLVQEYDSNLILPLNINIKIKYNSVTNDFTTDQTNLELLVANYLQLNATGTEIKFYKSQIVDLVHNYNSNIISVIVDVYDSNGKDLSDGIETIDENLFLSKLTTKLDIVKYTTVYWWWAIDGIRIELTV